MSGKRIIKLMMYTFRCYNLDWDIMHTQYDIEDYVIDEEMITIIDMSKELALERVKLICPRAHYEKIGEALLWTSQ